MVTASKAGSMVACFIKINNRMKEHHERHQGTVAPEEVMAQLKFKERHGDGETKYCEWCKEKHLSVRGQHMQSLVIDETMGCLRKKEGPEDERRDRKMEQDEVKEEVRGHTISGTEGYATDFVCILRSTGRQRKHFDKEE